MYSSVGRGSDEGQLNIREQKSGGGDERACVWWQWWWYRCGMLVTGSPAPGRKEVCGWQADKQQTDSRAKGQQQQRCRSSTDCGVVEEVAALLWDGANAVEWRRERQKRHFMQGPPLIWICRTNSLETDRQWCIHTTTTLPRHYHAHYELILARVRACVFLARVYQVRVRVEHCSLGDNRGKHRSKRTGHASQQRHQPMLVGERRLLLLLLLLLLPPLLYGCSFPTTHAPPVFMPTA